MAKKKSRSIVGLIGEAVSDVVDAASVAATGSQLGVLELAAEEEMKPAPTKGSEKQRSPARRRKRRPSRNPRRRPIRRPKKTRRETPASLTIDIARNV